MQKANSISRCCFVEGCSRCYSNSLWVFMGFLLLILALFRAQFGYLQCLSWVIFLLKQQWDGADSPDSMCQGVDDIKFSSQIVMNVQMQVLICMSGLPIHYYWGEMSDSGITKVSRNGMEPSSLLSPTVNCMHGSVELMCSRNLSLLCTRNVSSTYLFHILGGHSADIMP